MEWKGFSQYAAGCPTRRRQGARAFSLVELLVVVSVIALLIAVLLPSLKGARDQAKRLACASNLRSLMTAVQTYAVANDDRLITAGLAHGGSVDEHAAWIHTLERDYGNKLVGRCPADRSIHFTTPLSPTTQYRQASYASSYYTVKRLDDGRGPWNRMSLFRRPTSTILFAELAEKGDYAVADHFHPEQWWVDPSRLAREQLEPERHGGKANYAFVDTHVEVLPFGRTYEIDFDRSTLERIIWKHNLYDPDVAR